MLPSTLQISIFSLHLIQPLYINVKFVLGLVVCVPAVKCAAADAGKTKVSSLYLNI